ncbi:MAG: hypothetical protein JRH06_09870 [Deltaproteobacteria bacterium]|nr:hypothetical protein [Deltaproteobacteria bacterium]MBW2137851.1 hypothetical protein [Deltaproteobacteria bacterium]
MPSVDFKKLRLTENDLDFLVETVSPDVKDKPRLKQILQEDEDFKKSFICDEKVFHRIMDDEKIFLKVSPALFFEVLLRKAVDDLKEVGYTVEKTSHMRIPVFDSKEVVELLEKESLLVYLADMLSSFTRIESYTITFRAKGFLKKIRFNDLDINSLRHFSEAVGEEHRFGFYKRIADICLFILGIFPDYVERNYRYPFSGQMRPKIRGEDRIGPEEYESEGKKFYKLAAECLSDREPEISDIFWDLHGNFQRAKKPLNFISDHYLQYRRDKLFG